MEEIVIRHATPSDATDIIALCKAHANYEKTRFDTTGKAEKLMNHLFGPDQVLECIVTEQGGSLFGYATFMKQFSTWDMDFYLYMDCLYLSSEARDKGLGKMMMTFIAAYAKENDCHRIQWQTPSFNTGAKRFYHRLGAVPYTKERFIWEV